MPMTPAQRSWVDTLIKQGSASGPNDIAAPGPEVQAGARMTQPLGNIAPHNEQGYAIRDPATNARLSESEHIWAKSVIKEQTRNPQTGVSPYDNAAYENSTTLKTNYDTARVKTSGDMDALRGLRQGNPGPAELQDGSFQSAIDRELSAGAATGDASVTTEGVYTAAHGQLGELHSVGGGEARNVMSGAQDGDIDAVIDNMETTARVADDTTAVFNGRPASPAGAAPEAAAIGETEATTVARSALPATAEGAEGAAGAAGAEGGAASGLSGLAGAGAAGGLIAGGLALYDDIGKVRSGQMTGGNAAVDVGVKAAVGVGAGLAGAAAGAELGAAVGSIIPGAGTVIGLAAGAVVGGAVGYIGNEIANSDTAQAMLHEAGAAIDTGVDLAEKAGGAVEDAAGAAVDKVEDLASSAASAIGSLFD